MNLRALQTSCSVFCHVALYFYLLSWDVWFDTQSIAIIPTSRGHHTTCYELLKVSQTLKAHNYHRYFRIALAESHKTACIMIFLYHDQLHTVRLGSSFHNRHVHINKGKFQTITFPLMCIFPCRKTALLSWHNWSLLNILLRKLKTGIHFFTGYYSTTTKHRIPGCLKK